MKNIVLPIAFIALMLTNAYANHPNKLKSDPYTLQFMSAEKSLAIHTQQMDSQFYANNTWLKAASYPSQKLTYYWNDTTSDWSLVLRNLFEYDNNKNIMRNEYKDANDVTNFLYTYEYTNDNKEYSITQQSRFNNPSGTLQFTTREELSYNSAGMLIQRLIKKWDANTSAWYEDSRAVIDYDAHGNNSEYRIDQKIAGVWVTQYGFRALAQYDVQNRIIELKYMGWHADDSRYDTTYKLMYHYNNNLVSVMEHHNFDRVVETWSPVERTEINYVADTARQILFYLRDGNNWILNSATDELEWHVWTGDYNSSENVYKKFISQIWDADSNKLLNVFWNEMEFIDSNGSINIRQYEWENAWDLKTIQHIGYDSKKNLTANTYYNVINTQLVIEFSALYNNSYDQDGNLISMVQELFDTRIWAYVNTTKITFSNFVGIDKNARTKTLEIYPNPSEGKFFIKSSSNKLESASSKEEFKISIYDVMGQLILEHQFDLNNQSIDLSPFTNGIYFAKIGDETIKLVKH